ncbi:sensor histidine kinase [Gracilimonas amylolytica]|uniref:sensor histidine kinase n=1 Tax=Gracilimonas amylolytica TaxID=1749045 RepID=UPI000CD9050A|nr:HAMP domain-containing sensor histidine kinase [Gracilimonas amylolytica]
MKLNNKILISNSLLSLFMLVVTGLGTYYVVNTTIYDELDFHLLQHKADIQQQLMEDPNSLDEVKRLGGLGSYEWVEISDFDQSITLHSNNFSTIDTVRYAEVSELPESYRKLTTTLSVGGSHFLLEIFEEVAAWEKISMTVMLSVLAALFMWVILLYVVNQYAFGRILSPFYDTVDRLEHISSPNELGEPFPEPNTYEIRVLNNALNTMLTQIKSSFDDQRKFIQNASHELLTPLSIIRQKAEKLISDSEEPDPSSLERLHEIQQTAVRLTRLSNTLLLISRVENKQYEMSDQIDIIQIVERVLKELADFTEIKEITIETEFSRAVNIKGNRELIHSAVYNIIQNAIKFSPDGGKIRISIAENASDQIVLSVKDEGPGIPEDLIDQVFDRFRKGDKLSGHGSSSPGLGLSIVKSICELHGCEYKAVNNPDKGVSFSLIF